ncbi:unnamed protein product [Owenia fusiformis]|uniref:Uncharacterized protein n=1 Tax=Owenia fusiformis TaxID=6347 RepID=A0A8J1USY9_OWEFU|nr:unnamed protein product [Owenia fusiformis]
MPRRRHTKALNNHDKPCTPTGDEGKNLSIEDRRQKLKLLLEDYDNEVKVRVKSMRSDAKTIAKRINHALRLELIKLPMHIRGMNRLEFFNSGGNGNTSSKTEEISDIVKDVDSAIASTSAKIKTVHSNYETISEENEDQQQQATPASKRPLRKRAARKTKKGVLEESQSSNIAPSAPTAKSSRRTKTAAAAQFKTPAFKGGPSLVGFDTPAVTPKFDPRLPQTPGLVREPKPGERIMSLTGSPLSNARRTCTTSKVAEVYVSVGEGNVLQLSSDTDVKDVDIPEMDPQARANILLLQEKLAAILRQKDVNVS